LSRRSFIKGALTAGSVVALGGLAGCASSTTKDKAAAAPSTSTPIPPVGVPAKWDQEYQVVYVGSGAAGLLGAAKSAHGGVKVTVLEKGKKLGGAALYSTAAAAYGTKVQAAGGMVISDPVNQKKFYRKLWKAQDFSVNGSLMWTILRNGAAAIDFMGDKLGMAWEAPMADPENDESRYHLPAGKRKLRHIGVMGFAIDELLAAGERLGVKYQTETDVTALVKDGERIVGVKATQGGKDIYVKASKSVVLCAGGMANNRDMLKQYVPSALTDCGATMDMFGSGYAIRMGLGVGADTSGFDSYDAVDGGIPYFDKGLGPWYGFLYNGDHALARNEWLMINKKSERFGAIETGQMFERARYIVSQPDATAYVIFDADYPTTIWNFGEVGCRKPVTPDKSPDIAKYASVLDSTNWLDTVDKAIKSGAIQKADTLEDLGKKLGLDPAKFASVVKEYNGYCTAKADPKFGTDPKFLAPVVKAPFYGIEVRGLMMSTDCGLRVDADMRVLDEKGKAIPGLLAAGHTAGGFSGERSHAKPTPLTNMGICFCSGYTAGVTTLA
jgi:succinate dehydrogenase/fumarate reductase flavoprotein subunit